jgi:type I restriction enzyme M protein
VPELPELERVMDPDGAYQALEKILEFRNFSGHAHGVRSRYEVKDEVDRLEPVLLSALDSVGWLSGVSWNMVEQCQFIGNGFQLLGERLRGSNAEWEPFNRPSANPVIPDHIYVEGPSSNISIDLWPVAYVGLCSDENCHSRELFLLDSINGSTLSLRSLKDHSIHHNIES